jgi:hypothetical protein
MVLYLFVNDLFVILVLVVDLFVICTGPLFLMRST